jgi:putative transposase
VITYNAKITPININDDDFLLSLLEQQCKLVNEVSKLQFTDLKTLSNIKSLHNEFYYKARAEYPEIPSQIVIKCEQESLASYKSIKTNKHKITKPFEKRNLSLRLDKRIYSRTKDKYIINIITTDKRKLFKIESYPKLDFLMNNYDYSDPLIFVRSGQLFISLTFDVNPSEKEKKNLCLGVDLGIRRVASCSDGRLFIDKKFNKEKRKLRYLKRCLQSKGTKSARKHLKKIRGKERNINKNQTHLIANEILKTNANIIALENLKGIKKKKHKNENKNGVSQVPFFDLRRILTYKAENMGKHICLVSPVYTSQIDSVTGLKEGERRGCRFYAKSGVIYDADINAAINIARRSKHPISQGNLLDGQGVVNHPIACQTNQTKV